MLSQLQKKNTLSNGDMNVNDKTGNKLEESSHDHLKYCTEFAWMDIEEPQKILQ
jgi:hypothetical protein